MSCKYHLFRVLDGDDYGVDPDGDAGALVEVVLCRHLKKYRTIIKKNNNVISRPSVTRIFCYGCVGMFMQTFAAGLRLRIQSRR
jgi:hypothetical protein